MKNKAAQPVSKSPEIQLSSAEVLNLSPVAMYTCDLDGYLTFFNDAALKLWGNAPVIGNDKWCGSWKLYHIDGSSMAIEESPVAIAIKKGKAVKEEEIIIERPDGSRLNVISHPNLIKDASGNTVGAINILSDVTSLRNTEQKLCITSSHQLETAAELILARQELSFQNEEKRKRASELAMVNSELSFQSGEKEKRANELFIANLELVFQNEEKGKRAAELIIANEELIFQNREKEKRSEELVIANKELAFQSEEKEKRAAELIIANAELIFQNGEKSKRASELIQINKELAFQMKNAAELIIINADLVLQNSEKEKRSSDLAFANEELALQNVEKGKWAAELFIVNGELAFQNQEKEKRAAELIIANRELAIQDTEKSKRAAELMVANQELVFQNEEKEKRAAELVIANDELAFQNEEKGKRAAELIIANSELAFQSVEKEKRAAELIIANSELAFQNKEKEKRAAELLIANKELVFQNEEKGKRAAELALANVELLFQNEEKEKRAAELIIANQELEAFSYVSSHDLQEPLRKIQAFSAKILASESQNLSDTGKDYFNRIQSAAGRMRILINDLLTFSHLSTAERKFENTDLNILVEEVKQELKEIIDQSHAVVEASNLCEVCIIPFQFRQIMHNLISNAIKFSKPESPPHVVIKSKIVDGEKLTEAHLTAEKYCHISVSDNGIGFDEHYKEHIFEVFKRLHSKEEYPGTGIGLSIVKKVVDNHSGLINATSKPGEGSIFNIYIPVR